MAETAETTVRAIYHTDMKKLGERVKDAEARAQQAEQRAQEAVDEVTEIKETLEDLEEASEWQARFEALLSAIKDSGCATEELKSAVNELVREVPAGGLTFGFQWGI